MMTKRLALLFALAGVVLFGASLALGVRGESFVLVVLGHFLGLSLACAGSFFLFFTYHPPRKGYKAVVKGAGWWRAELGGGFFEARGAKVVWVPSRSFNFVFVAREDDGICTRDGVAIEARIDVGFRLGDNPSDVFALTEKWSSLDTVSLEVISDYICELILVELKRRIPMLQASELRHRGEIADVFAAVQASTERHGISGLNFTTEYLRCSSASDANLSNSRS
jgi:hypothetical protein